MENFKGFPFPLFGYSIATASQLFLLDEFILVNPASLSLLPMHTMELLPTCVSCILELQSVRKQLASEQSICFKLEVELAEQRQKLQTMEALPKELELLQRQKAASEQAALNAKKHILGGIWGWLARTPDRYKTSFLFYS